MSAPASSNSRRQLMLPPKIASASASTSTFAPRNNAWRSVYSAPHRAAHQSSRFTSKKGHGTIASPPKAFTLVRDRSSSSFKASRSARASCTALALTPNTCVTSSSTMRERSADAASRPPAPHLLSPEALSVASTDAPALQATASLHPLSAHSISALIASLAARASHTAATLTPSAWIASNTAWRALRADATHASPAPPLPSPASIPTASRASELGLG
mmetsp:Transcript_2033/g.8100  ORF Transcript_2033/g.8100 Transcript_2033/m.8100 type:complete len:218 (+) Transcript_2033:313-966(+)